MRSGIVPICVDEALYNRSVRSFINRGNRYVAADTEKTRPHRSSTQTAGGAKGLASDRVFSAFEALLSKCIAEALVAQLRKEADAHGVDVLTWLARNRVPDE